MNKAINRQNGEIIYANSLKNIENLNSIQFKCHSENCEISVYPASFKNKCKQAPHFRKYKNTEHSEKCVFALKNTIINKGLNGNKLNNSELSKLGYPQKFDIKENDFSSISYKVIINKVEGKNITTENHFSKTTSELSPFGKKKNVSQIFQIVDFYLSFPANRDAHIDFNGKRTNYDDLFKEILVNRKYINQNTQMFYTRLLISNDRDPNKTLKDFYSNFYIKLFPGDKKDQHEKINRYELIIKKNDLTPTKINLIKSNFLEEYEKSKNKKDKHDLYVFFVGNAPKLPDDTKFDLINNYIYFKYTDVRETNYDSF